MGPLNGNKIMLSLKNKDIQNRLIFKKIEKSRKIKKFLFVYLLNNSINKQFLRYYFCEKKSSKSKTKLVRRCVLTNRNRGIIRGFNISRIALRELILFGLIPGFSKAVW